MLLSIDDVRRAAAVLEGVARRTPSLTSTPLDEAVTAGVALKCECLQRTGAFKFRGAYNLISSLSAAERARGVCTVSSGNHAQAVALAARLLDVRAAILMPADAPPEKVAATRSYGAEVELYDRRSMPQVEAGRRFQAERGMTFVTAYDDPRIAAGAGTAALELFADAGPFDMIVAPASGGGGISGHSTVAKALAPDCRVIAVEPAAGGNIRKSLDAGERVAGDIPDTIADGLMLTAPGEYTFEVIRERVDDAVAVTDAEIVDAMLFLFTRVKLVVEPSGAAAVAALLAGKVDVAGRRVGVVVTGGNIAPARFFALTKGR